MFKLAAERLHDLVIGASNNAADYIGPKRGGFQQCTKHVGLVGASRTFTCNAGLRGRYVIVMIESKTGVTNDVLTMCELEVYGSEAATGEFILIHNICIGVGNTYM